MTFQDKIKINKHRIIEERGNQFAEILSGEEKKYVLSIVENSKDILRQMGNDKFVVYSPNNQDWKQFKTATKRYIRTDFIEVAQLRIKIPPQTLIEMTGICSKCLINEPRYIYGTYDLCYECDEIVDFMWQIEAVQIERKNIIEREFHMAIDETKFPDELVGNWMLLMRKMREDKESKHIDNELRLFIRDELINEFKQQNKQLIQKYGL